MFMRRGRVFIKKPSSPHECSFEDVDVVVDLGLVPLRYALSDPDNVSTLLFLQLHVGVEHTKVELLHERVHVQLGFVLKELVLQRLVARVGAGAVEQWLVLRVRRCDLGRNKYDLLTSRSKACGGNQII